MTIDRRILMIANPVAGSQARALAEGARQYLQNRNCSVTLYFTRAAGDAERRARQCQDEDYTLIVAAGGDGTLNEVVNGMYPGGIPLAFLPLGTTNVFALEVGISFDVYKACEQILTGLEAPVFLGCIDGRLFTLMASAGFDAEVVRRVDGRWKARLGKFAYVYSALRTYWRYPFPQILVNDGNGQSVSGYGVVVSNARYYGGRFVLSPSASLRKSSLEVCVLTRPGRFALLLYSFFLLIRKPFPRSMSHFFTTGEVRIDGEGVAVQVDGDDVSCFPAKISLASNPITMILPR
ncbi:MAG: lipid kinase [Desulfuromonas sp.]|nr:MAG: lipid kinase [Desulfuromonas sp.]